MAKPKKTAPIKIVSIEIGELKGLLGESEKRALSKEEAEKLGSALDTLALITQELESKRTSLKRLRRMIFGPSSEKTKDILKDVDKGTEGEGEGEDKEGEDKEGDTVAGNEGAVEASSSTDEKGEDKKTDKKRKGHGRIGAAAYTGAKRVSILAELTHKQPCPECETGKLYRQIKPKVLVRVTGMAPLSATVYELERFRCNLCGKIFTAKPPEGVGDSKYDDTVAPMLGILKYGTGLPFYRLAGLQKQLGIPLPAGTQWQLLLNGELKYFAPAHKELIRQAAQGTVLHNDDTTMMVLDLKRKIVAELLLEEGEDEEEKGGRKKGRRKKRTGIFTSGIVSIGSGHQIALFFTGVKHAGENLADVLKHRSKDLGLPIQMCDGLAASVPSEFETILANCIAHGRRNFVDVAEAFPDECRYVLESFSKIYQIDAFCKAEGYDAETRLQMHQEHSKPVMDDFKTWLDRQFDEKLVEPNSSLGKAISYLLNRWSKLTLFLTVAGAPLDNNICERAIKKAILHRKNALFYKTVNGARVGDTYMSLIYTCELNGVNPFEYLQALQKHHEEVKRAPARWMPWNFEETILNLPS